MSGHRHGFRKDFIERGPSGLSENIEELRFRGVEFSALNSSLPWLDLRLGYTFLDSENQSDGVVEDDLQNRPRHKAVLEATARLGDRVRLFVSESYFAGAVTLDNNATESKDIDSYHLVNAKLAFAVVPDRLSIHGRVENLLDSDYQESYGFPQPGRTLFAGIEGRF